MTNVPAPTASLYRGEVITMAQLESLWAGAEYDRARSILGLPAWVECPACRWPREQTK